MKRLYSGKVIGQLLHCEGFSPHVAMCVRKWVQNHIANERVRQRARRNRRAFKDMMRRLNLSDADKMVLGRFVSTEVKASFEAGLRIGLASNFCLSNGGEPETPIERLAAFDSPLETQE